jgi:hypothetical protein
MLYLMFVRLTGWIALVPRSSTRRQREYDTGRFLGGLIHEYERAV